MLRQFFEKVTYVIQDFRMIRVKIKPYWPQK